jgi:hypothetical protein
LVIIKLYFCIKDLLRNISPVVPLFFIARVLTVTLFVSTSIQGKTKCLGEGVVREEISRTFLFRLQRQQALETICFLSRLS